MATTRSIVDAGSRSIHRSGSFVTGNNHCTVEGCTKQADTFLKLGVLRFGVCRDHTAQEANYITIISTMASDADSVTELMVGLKRQQETQEEMGRKTKKKAEAVRKREQAVQIKEAEFAEREKRLNDAMEKREARIKAFEETTRRLEAEGIDAAYLEKLLETRETIKRLETEASAQRSLMDILIKDQLGLTDRDKNEKARKNSGNGARPANSPIDWAPEPGATPRRGRAR